MAAQLLAHVLAARIEGDLDLVEQAPVHQLFARQRGAVVGHCEIVDAVEEAKFQNSGSGEAAQP